MVALGMSWFRQSMLAVCGPAATAAGPGGTSRPAGGVKRGERPCDQAGRQLGAVDSAIQGPSLGSLLPRRQQQVQETPGAGGSVHGYGLLGVGRRGGTAADARRTNPLFHQRYCGCCVVCLDRPFRRSFAPQWICRLGRSSC